MKNYFFAIIVIALFAVCSCKDPYSSKLDSDDYENKQERIDKLAIEIKSFSDFHDAEFELFNVNGFHDQRSSVPGASSLHYRFVVKIDTVDIPKWIEGMTQIEPEKNDDGWTQEIIKNRKQNWMINSKPKYYVRGEGVTKLVFHDEGIVFTQVIQN